MTLQDYANDSYWKISEELNKFFAKQPKFKLAEIIKEGEIDYNFSCEYKYSYCWLVKLPKGQHYNVILSNGGVYRHSPEGIRVQRYYTKDEKPIRKRWKYECDHEYVRTQSVVECNFTNTYRNDCQIWTLAKCLNITYQEAAKHLIESGWSENNARGYYFHATIEKFAIHQQIYSKYMTQDKIKGSTIGNITKQLPKIGTFTIQTKDHILCVVDGVIYDSAFHPNSRVRSIHLVIKK